METQVYYRFEVTKVDGSKVKLRIQDLRKEDIESLIEFVRKYYIHEEANWRATGSGKSEAATEEMISLYRHTFKDKVRPLVCYVDYDDQDKVEIVGCNMLRIEKKGNEDHPQVQEEENVKLMKLGEEYGKAYDLAEALNVEEYLDGIGLSVDPSYRGCGIATELLKARKPMIQRRGYKVTSAWFSSVPSQKAAEKAGYEQVAQISHEELGRRVGVTFTDCPTFFKFMILRA